MRSRAAMIDTTNVICVASMSPKAPQWALSRKRIGRTFVQRALLSARNQLHWLARRELPNRSRSSCVRLLAPLTGTDRHPRLDERRSCSAPSMVIHSRRSPRRVSSGTHLGHRTISRLTRRRSRSPRALPSLLSARVHPRRSRPIAPSSYHLPLATHSSEHDFLVLLLYVSLP